MKEMNDVKKKVGEARDAIRDILKEFVPARDHAVGAGKELLMAMREVIDAEIRLIDKGRAKAKPKPAAPKPTAKKPSAGGPKGGTA